MGKEEIQGHLAKAEAYKGPEPLPLVPYLPKAKAYPIEALGPVLGPAVLGIAEKFRADPALCAHSVLTGANLMAQASIDVVLPFGATVPVSLYFLTSAESGERKSQSDKAALAAIRAHAGNLRTQYDIDWADYERECRTYDVLAKKVEKDRKLETKEAMNEALAKLGEKPAPPVRPELIYTDVTTEGLQKSLRSGQSNAVLTTDEGAIFLGGHAMNKDNALKTMGFFANLWSDGDISVSRALEGNMQVSGKRLTAHIMVQPSVVQGLLNNTLAREQGFLARFLVAAPLPLAGTRFYRDTPTEAEAAIQAFENAMLAQLARIDTNNIDRMPVGLSEEAKALWVGFHDAVEAELALHGQYADLKPIAGRMPEQVMRLAATIAFASDTGLEAIDGPTMQGAIQLGHYYLSEALRIYEGAKVDQQLANAEKLRVWILDQKGPIITKRDIMQYGPNALQRAQVLEPLLSTLVQHGWLIEAPAGGVNRDGTKCRDAWHVASRTPFTVPTSPTL